MKMLVVLGLALAGLTLTGCQTHRGGTEDSYDTGYSYGSGSPAPNIVGQAPYREFPAGPPPGSAWHHPTGIRP